MIERVNINAPPNSPKPEYKPMQQVKEYQGYGQLTNAEIYGAIALILMELESEKEEQ